jgi:hypothetical protein
MCIDEQSHIVLMALKFCSTIEEALACKSSAAERARSALDKHQTEEEPPRQRGNRTFSRAPSTAN